jgi:ketosteroid isomerase-like protein
MSAIAATRLVRHFLGAMEARDLAAARAMLAPGFAMTFPGGARFATLEELIAWARPRYQWVRKRYERFDEAPGADAEERIVYCYGTLHGVWPDGTAFEGIRFIDRFAVRGGLLADQLVWNDLAEIQARGRT